MTSAIHTARNGKGQPPRPRLRVPGRLATLASKQLAALRPSHFATRVQRPAFIVGCGRSGTTLLNVLFDRHGEVANFPSEANDLWHPELYPWHAATLDAPPFFIDPRAFTAASLAARRPVDDLRLKSTFGAFQTLSRKPVFLNKTVMVTFMLPKVVELFPDARFVHLVRDGRAVAVSWLDKEREKLTHPRYAERGYRFDEDALLEIYARHWQDHVLALDEAIDQLGLLRSGRIFEVSYEALCADPAARLADLAGFLGVSPDPFRRADLGYIRNSNDKARSRLTSERVAALSRAADRALASRGYGRDIA